MTSAFDIKSLAEYLAQEDEDCCSSLDNYESNTSHIGGQFGNINGIYSGEEEQENSNTKKTYDGGEITKMLQNSLGVLPPTDRLPTNSITNHKTNTPEIITDDNLPIFLDEKYFKVGNNAMLASNGSIAFNAKRKYYTGREIYMMKRNHTKLNDKKSK